MAERTLLESALDCDDALEKLRCLRDALPRHATKITAILSELFAVSAALREIHNAEHSWTYGPFFIKSTTTWLLYAEASVLLLKTCSTCSRDPGKG